MSQRTSFNYNSERNGGRAQKALDFVRQYQPTTFLIMNGPTFAKQMALLYPATKVIHRQYFAEGAGDEGSVWRNWSPGQYIDRVTRELKPADNVWIYILNEPWAEEHELPRLLNWLIETMHELNRRGYRGVIGNFGPACFEPWHVDSGVFDNYLRVLGDYSAQGRMLGGWHEYTAILMPYGVGKWAKTDLLNRDLVQVSHWPVHVPVARVAEYAVGNRSTTLPPYWHLMRITWFDLRAQTIGAKIHQKVITEGFWDRMPDMTLEADNVYVQLERRFGTSGHATLRCAKSLRAVWKYYFPAWSFDQAAYQQLMWAEKVYPPSVIGWNLFTWSFGAPDWDTAYGCNYGDMDELMTLLVSNKASEPGASKPVTYKALPGVGDLRWTNVVVDVPGPINVRITPTTETEIAPLTTVKRGDAVAVIDADAAKEGVWLPIKVGAVIGWISGAVFGYRTPFGAPVVELNVPFVTQVGTGINQCLPASVAMAVNYYAGDDVARLVSVADVVRDMNKGDAYAHINQALALSGLYGVNFFNGAPLTWTRIKAELDGGHPVIALLDRSKLKPWFGNFGGAHFLVVTGYGDGYVIVNDPLGTQGGNGDGWKVPKADFDSAVYQSPGNSVQQGIFTAASVVVPEVPSEPEWFVALDAREQKEIRFALAYDTPEFRHGTDGHNRLLLLAKVARFAGLKPA